MKTIFSICLLFISSLLFAQSQDVNKFIKSYYNEHNKVWQIKNFQYSKLDLIQSKYLTSNCRKESHEWYQDGHDYLTNDWGIRDESFKTFTIKKDSLDKDLYIISYEMITYPVSLEKAVLKMVSFKIKVIKKKDQYFIDKMIPIE